MVPEIHGRDITVYSAVFGNYDRVRDPEVINHDCRYVLYTDKLQKTPGIWEQQTIRLEGLEEFRLNRWCKTHSHLLFPKAKWTIYVDGQLQLTVDPVQLVRECLQWSPESQLFLFRHHERQCLYDEAEAILRIRKDRRPIVQAQIARYAAKGFPKNWGLFLGGFLIRRQPCAAFNKLWWDEIRTGSHRDQISLPYVLRQFPLSSSFCPLPALWWTNYVTRHQHEPTAMRRAFKQRARGI